MENNCKMSRFIVQVAFRLRVFVFLSVLVGVFCWLTFASRLGALLHMMSAIAFFMCVFVCLGWILYCLHRCMRKTVWRISSAGVLFVWAGLVFFSEDLCSERSHWWLMAAFVFYVCAIMFSLFGRVAFNWLRIQFTADAVKNVFWGLSERECLMARSIVGTSATANVQFNLPIEKYYDPAARARLTDLADELDAIWVFQDFSSLGRNAHRGRRHFFLSDNGYVNLSLADQIVRAVVDDPKSCSEKELYVRIGDIDHEELFVEWAHKAYERSGHLIRPVVIHEPEMIARRFVQDFPPLASKSMEGKIDAGHATVRGVGCRTLLLGLDHTGRALLNMYLGLTRHIGEDGRTVVPSPVTVIDMRADRWSRYCLSCPEIASRKEDYGLQFIDMQVGYEPFEKWFRGHHADYDRIVFCLNGDAINIREAIRIRTLLAELCDFCKELIVRVADPRVNRFAPDDNDERFSLQYFGNLQDIYHISFLQDDPVEKMAQVINWQWNVNLDLDSASQNKALIHEKSGILIKEQRDDIRRFWEKASYYQRYSSRASAMGALSFMRLLGITCKSAEKPDQGEREVPIKEVNDKIDASRDVLARTEHLRWCAYQSSMGVRRWELEEPRSLKEVVDERLSQGEKSVVPNSLANQTATFRAHAALVDFDKLPEIDLRLARAVDPKLGDKLTEDMFVGFRSRPDIGGGRRAASLQCKDYDCWSVIPEAAQLAGLRFFTSGDGCGNAEDQPVERAFWKTLHVQMKRLWDWMTRDSLAQSCSYAEKTVSMTRWEELKKYTVWVKEAYNDAIKLTPHDARRPYDGFLNSNLIEKLGGDSISENRVRRSVFWFDDVVSPYRVPLFGANDGKCRYAYVFDYGTGLIVPLYRFPRKFREQQRTKAGISGRRVNFDAQPDFVAQVLEADGRIVVIFRGTVTLSDWCENALQCLGRIPPQFRLAADLVRAICEKTSADILLLGHSEGGGEVQYSLMKNSLRRWTMQREIRGVTFNSQRLSPRIIDYLLKFGANKQYAHSNIDNFRAGADVVSGWLALGIDLLGKVYTIGKNGGFWKVWTHKIGWFCKELQKTPPHAVVEESRRI